MTDEAIDRTIYVLVAIFNHAYYRLCDQPLVRLSAERHIKVCGRVQGAGCTCDQRKNDAD
jgi:hypothetical protein